MTHFAGINRGLLFGIGECPYKDYVYVTHPQYPLDPFANLKLEQVFHSSAVILSDFEDVSNEQEVAEFFHTLPVLLQTCLSPADLEKLRHSLEPILERLPALKERWAPKNEAAAITALALFAILNSIKTRHNRLEGLSSELPPHEATTKQHIQNRATLLSKHIVPLSLQEDMPKVKDVFSLLMQEPELLRALLFAFTQPDILSLFSDVNAFERGWYDKEQRIIPDMMKERLLRAFLSQEGIDLGHLLQSPIIPQLAALLSAPSIPEKIVSFVQTDIRHLFFVSPYTFEKWPWHSFPLTQIKTRLKPVGFYWTVRDQEGHEGILMGSMHTTAEKLVNYPQRILELFDRSDAMAIEIDISREDIVKRLHEVSWEKSQAQELESLSSADKEALFQLLKTEYPYIEAPSTNPLDLDAETLFILETLQFIRLAILSSYSDLKDKDTGQSFCSTGMEIPLMQRAKEKKIPIRDLENFDDRVSSTRPSWPIFTCEQLKKRINPSKESIESTSSSSDGRDTLDSLFETLQKHPLQKLTDTMENGDMDALEVIYLAAMQDPVQQALNIQRNQNMAKRIGDFMKSGNRHFCIAGALHMAGPSSIVALLKQTGYTVERLIVEEPLEPCADPDKEVAPPMEPSTTNPPEDSASWQTIPAKAISYVVNIISWPLSKLPVRSFFRP
ncbi:MAG: TraB/GumN family protein [Verrucomicrobia bacterium]|nr:TraB/GumN family protein [Verrucomicrobiota bacterium]